MDAMPEFSAQAARSLGRGPAKPLPGPAITSGRHRYVRPGLQAPGRLRPPGGLAQTPSHARPRRPPVEERATGHGWKAGLRERIALLPAQLLVLTQLVALALVAQRLLDTCVRYANGRKQFGQPIAKFQLVASRLVDMKLRLGTSRALLHQAGWMKTRGRSIFLEAALAKLHISESWVA